MKENIEVLKQSLPIWIACLFAILCALIKDFNYEFAKSLYFSLLFIGEVILVFTIYKYPPQNS